MGYFKQKDEGYKMQNINKETVQDVLKYPFVDAIDRGIRKDICEKFGVRSAVIQQSI